MNQSFKKSTIFLIVLMILGFATFLIIIAFISTLSAMPFEFIQLELGKFFGIPFGYEVLLIVLFVIGTSALMTLWFLRLRKLSTREIFNLIKKKRTIKLVIVSLAVSLLLLFSFYAILISGVAKEHSKLNAFVSENADVSLQDYIDKTESFLSNNVNNSYKKPESNFEIDQWLYSTLLDPALLNSLGLTRADVILYQGWGACGQFAIVTEEIMHDAGYTTRRARFVGEGADHEWAEVKWNGTWFIVDPGYIGKLVEIENLRERKPEFQNYTTVEVMYRNGTRFDLGKDYGYYSNLTLCVLESRLL